MRSPLFKIKGNHPAQEHQSQYSRPCREHCSRSVGKLLWKATKEAFSPVTYIVDYVALHAKCFILGHKVINTQTFWFHISSRIMYRQADVPNMSPRERGRRLSDRQASGAAAFNQPVQLSEHLSNSATQEKLKEAKSKGFTEKHLTSPPSNSLHIRHHAALVSVFQWERHSSITARKVV